MALPGRSGEMKRVAGNMRRMFRCLIGRQKGQTSFTAVLVLLVLGGLVLTPMLSFTISGLKQEQSHEETMPRFYAADAGIEDAMWRIRNYEDGDWPDWMRGDWGDATFNHDPAYWEYTLPQFNAKDITVRIQPTWLLEGLETPKSGQGKTPNTDVEVTGNVVGAGRYELAILKDAGFAGPLMIERIGVWLPGGFDYVVGSSNLEQMSVPLPPAGYRCTPTTYTFRNGTAIIWDYVAAYGSPVDYTRLPLDKSGTVTSYLANHLRDTVSNQFQVSDAGRSVWDITDDQWGVISNYNSRSDLTLLSNLFDSGDVGNRYGIGEPNRRVVSFSYTPTTTIPYGAFCWVSSPGNADPAVDPYLWWSGDKIYQITSIGEDPATGDTTTLIVYTSKEELKNFGVSMLADYEPTGNTLARTVSDVRYRERVYLATPAQVTVLPARANVQQLRLYWSGWKNYPWDAWDLSDAQRSALVPDNLVDRVSFRVEYSGVVYETTVVADSWQVLPNGTAYDEHGWSYACYADVTEEIREYYAARGITFGGNAKYTVGHADVSGATTANPLQGVWGSSAADVYNVGSAGTILHYDGANWQLMASGTTRDLYAVWGSSPADIYAVGQRGTILHYDGVDDDGDGSLWDTMSSGTTDDLRGVWGDSSYIYVVGEDGTIRRCAVGSTSWNGMSSGTSRDLYGVWGDASYIYVVGSRGTIHRCAVGSTSWNGMSSGTGSTLYSIWGDSSYIYVVGSSGTIRRCAVGSTNWSGMSSGTTTQLNGVWGSAWNDVFAVGNSGSIRHCDGTGWSSMVGNYPLYEWKEGHSGETIVGGTDHPLTNTTRYGSSSLDEWAYAAWSLVTIYTSPETKGHQLYIYDTFRYINHYQTIQFDITDFLAPQDVLTDPNAARLTVFVGEGDEIYTGDRLSVNGSYLSGGIPYACNPVSDVFNSKSSVVGTSNIGIDLDTFAVAYPIIRPGDTAAVVKLETNIDIWNVIYVVLSFRSEITSGGISSMRIQ
jgi:hypothetical protein